MCSNECHFNSICIEKKTQSLETSLYMNILVGTFLKIICPVLLLINTDGLMNGQREKEQRDQISN